MTGDRAARALGAPDPRSAAELASALRALHEESDAYWQSFSTERFLAPIGTAWSPAENVRHLTKSMRAVTVGLRVPRWLLLLRFGRGRGDPRDFAAMRETYRARLAEGADAGRFAPGRRPPPPDPEDERRRIMAQHREALEALVDAMLAWPERALDRRRLPHPLLGPVTVREMLHFMLYHNRHHVEVVRRRLHEGDSTPR